MEGYVFVPGFFRARGYAKYGTSYIILSKNYSRGRNYCIKPNQTLTLLHVLDNSFLKFEDIHPCFDGWFRNLDEIYLRDASKITRSKCPDTIDNMTLENALVHFSVRDSKIKIFDFEQKVHIATFKHPFIIQLSKKNRAFRPRFYVPGDGPMFILKKGETFRLAMSVYYPSSVSPDLYDAAETFDSLDFQIGNLIKKFEPYKEDHLGFLTKPITTLYDYQIYLNGLLIQDGLKVFEYIGVDGEFRWVDIRFQRLKELGEATLYKSFSQHGLSTNFYQLEETLWIQQHSPLETNFYLECDGYLKTDDTDPSGIRSVFAPEVIGDGYHLKSIGLPIKACWLYRKGEYHLDKDCDGKDNMAKPIGLAVLASEGVKRGFEAQNLDPENPIVKKIIKHMQPVWAYVRGSHIPLDMSIYDSQGFVKKGVTFHFSDYLDYEVRILTRADSSNSITYEMNVTLFHEYRKASFVEVEGVETEKLKDGCLCKVTISKDWEYPDQSIIEISEDCHRDLELDEDTDLEYISDYSGNEDNEELWKDKHTTLRLVEQGKVTQMRWGVIKYLDARLLKALAVVHYGCVCSASNRENAYRDCKRRPSIIKVQAECSKCGTQDYCKIMAGAFIHYKENVCMDCVGKITGKPRYECSVCHRSLANPR